MLLSSWFTNINPDKRRKLETSADRKNTEAFAQHFQVNTII